MTLQIPLTDLQYDFVTATDQFPAFVAGFASGKTHAAISRAIALKLQYPGQNVAYYLPTYDLVRNISFPRFAEMFDTMRISAKINKTNAVVEVAIAGNILFRTMDTPERIIGYEVADSLADELDTIATEKARNIWNKIIFRNLRKKPDGNLNTVGVAITPEGFRFVYDRWVKNPAPGYRIIEASTHSNARNPAVKDRVLSVNAMIHKDSLRRYRVHTQHCPSLVESLEKQAYDKHGEPDKSAGLDYVIDAAGYFIAHRYPIKKRTIGRVSMAGV